MQHTRDTAGTFHDLHTNSLQRRLITEKANPIENNIKLDSDTIFDIEVSNFVHKINWKFNGAHSYFIPIKNIIDKKLTTNIKLSHYIKTLLNKLNQEWSDCRSSTDIENFINRLDTIEKLIKEIITQIPNLYNKAEEMEDEAKESLEDINVIFDNINEFKQILENKEIKLEEGNLNQMIMTYGNPKTDTIEFKTNLVYSEELTHFYGYLCSFRYIFENLERNVREHKGSKKNITFEVSSKVIDGEIILEFKENGPGINEEDLSVIRKDVFSDEFSQDKIKGQKRGLGLNLIYKIITAHGGRIEIESRHGEGTQLTIYLPASRGFITDYTDQAVNKSEGCI